MNEFLVAVAAGLVVALVAGLAGAAWREPRLFAKFVPWLFLLSFGLLTGAGIWNAAVLQAKVQAAVVQASDGVMKAIDRAYIPTPAILGLVILSLYVSVVSTASFFIADHRRKEEQHRGNKLP